MKDERCEMSDERFYMKYERCETGAIRDSGIYMCFFYLIKKSDD